MAHPYLNIVRERLDAYAAHLATMAVSPELKAWAADMAARHGPKVGVNFLGRMVVIDNEIVDLTKLGVDWLTALLIVRYGEAVEGPVMKPEFAKQRNAVAEAAFAKGERDVAWEHNDEHYFTKQHWPAAFSELDVAKARSWASGKFPGDLTFFAPEG
jgi:hypothetical protein